MHFFDRLGARKNNFSTGKSVYFTQTLSPSVDLRASGAIRLEWLHLQYDTVIRFPADFFSVLAVCNGERRFDSRNDQNDIPWIGTLLRGYWGLTLSTPGYRDITPGLLKSDPLHPHPALITPSPHSTFSLSRHLSLGFHAWPVADLVQDYCHRRDRKTLQNHAGRRYMRRKMPIKFAVVVT